MNGEVNIALSFHVEENGEVVDRSFATSIQNVTEKSYEEIVKRVQEMALSFPRSGDMTE